MQCLKFGVMYDGRSTLMNVNSSAPLSQILQIALNQLNVKDSDITQFCFMQFDEKENSKTRITEENRELLKNNVVHLVKKQVLTAKHAIEQLRSELHILQWQDSQCQRLCSLLSELSSSMLYSQFAIEFIKASGHELMFRFVENFPFDEKNNQVASTQLLSVWSALMACLSQLSEYGISSTGEDDPENHLTQSLNPPSGTQCINLNDQNYEDRSQMEMVCPVISPSLKELFSWHLVSQKFVAVLIGKFLMERDLVSLKNELKVILKLLNHCSTCAQKVASHTNDDFALLHLQTIHAYTVGQDLDQTEFTSVSKANCSHLINLEEHTAALEFERLPKWTFNLLRNELMCLLLDCLYALLCQYERSGQLAVFMPIYLNSQTLLKLTSYFPQMQIRSSHMLARTTTFRTQKLPAEVGVGRTSARTSRGGSIFFYHHTSLLENPAEHSADSIHFMSPIYILYKLQRLQFVLITNELSTAISNHEKSSILEQIRHLLLQACGSDRTYLPMIDAQLEPLRHYFQSETSDQCCPQFTTLHFNCLRAFLKSKLRIVPQLLSYGYGRQPNTVNSDCNPQRILNSFSEELSTQDKMEHLKNFTPNRYLHVFSEKSISGYQSSNKTFPLIPMVTELAKILCELLHIGDRTKPCDHLESYKADPDLKLFYPMFFKLRTSEMTSFEDVFVTTLCLLFDTWMQLNACSYDMNGVLLLLRDQLAYTIEDSPISLEHFEQLLRQRIAQVVRDDWKRIDQLHPRTMRPSHKYIQRLNEYLTKVHRFHVEEQRINALINSAPLEYLPQKSVKQTGRENVKYLMFLSPDRKSLVILDQTNSTHGLWPLTWIERISIGPDERNKKILERTITFHLTIRDTNEQEEWGWTSAAQAGKSQCIQHLLLARNDAEYDYWIDGLYILRLVNSPSKRFEEDIQLLVALDMRLRISGLDSIPLPQKCMAIPADPPDFDFQEP